MGSFVDYEVRDGIGYIHLKRPEVLNALTDDMILELKDMLYAFDDDQDAKVAILSGSGRAFCSGADVRQRQLRPREELARLGSAQGRGSHLDELFYRSVNWKPIIAAVHGYAVGAGLYLAFMCEMIVAAEGTQFQITETSRGVDSTNFWALLAHRTNGGFSTDVALTGRFWSAEEGSKWGGVDRLVPAGQHITAAEELAREIMSNPPLSVRAMVEARRGTNEEIEMQARLRRPRGLHLTEDFHESALAFVEKRQPVFQGR